MIYFQCPTCRKELKAQDGFAGRKVECPDCGQRLLIPPPEQATGDTVLGLRVPNPTVPAKTTSPAARKSAPAPSSTDGAAATGWIVLSVFFGSLFVSCGGVAGFFALTKRQPTVVQPSAASEPWPPPSSPWRNSSSATDPEPDADIEPESMTLAAFLAQRPKAPTKVTVECRLENFYFGAYRETARSHYSLVLDDPWGLGSGHGHAYVPKHSRVGIQIFARLKDGERHRLTAVIVLQGPDGSRTPPDREEMAIVKVCE